VERVASVAPASSDRALNVGNESLGVKTVAKKKEKSNAQIYLEQVEKVDAIIKNKLIEKHQWHDIALGITANMDGERVQSSGAKSKMANALDKCVDMEHEIDNLIDEFIDLKREITHTLEQLQSPIQYKVLHMKYIQYDKYPEFWDIADKFGKDYSWATTLHGRALKNVQKILDNKENL
jgi:RNase H-fold protein (predicted Holliday junction resolvase)